MDIRSRFDIFEPGDSTALVCIDESEIQTAVVDQLDTLGFKIHTGLFAEDISLKMASQTYDVVIIYENFNHADLESNPVLSIVSNLAQNQRREMFVILVGPDFVTANGMQAFQHGVDMVFAIADVINFAAVVRRGIQRHMDFYRRFKECLAMSEAI